MSDICCFYILFKRYARQQVPFFLKIQGTIALQEKKNVFDFRIRLQFSRKYVFRESQRMTQFSLIDTYIQGLERREHLQTTRDGSLYQCRQKLINMQTSSNSQVKFLFLLK